MFCSPAFTPPPPILQRQILYCPRILPLPERHVLGFTQYVAFSDGLLSLRNMHLSFLCVFSLNFSLSLIIFHRLAGPVRLSITH